MFLIDSDLSSIILDIFRKAFLNFTFDRGNGEQWEALGNIRKFIEVVKERKMQEMANFTCRKGRVSVG